MIALADMERRARSHLRSARILARKAYAEFDAAAYLCGYAVEIALKVRLCRRVGRTDFPENNAEFATQGMNVYKTHNLSALLQHSGMAPSILSDPSLSSDWWTINAWNPEQRYSPVGSYTAQDAQEITDATRRLLRALL